VAARKQPRPVSPASICMSRRRFPHQRGHEIAAMDRRSTRGPSAGNRLAWMFRHPDLAHPERLRQNEAHRRQTTATSAVKARELALRLVRLTTQVTKQASQAPGGPACCTALGRSFLPTPSLVGRLTIDGTAIFRGPQHNASNTGTENSAFHKDPRNRTRPLKT